MRKLQRSSVAKCCAVWVAAFGLSMPVSGAGAWVAVPSAVSGAVVTIQGGGLPAGSTLTVRVTDPTGQQHSQVGAVTADGRLSATLTPGAEGKHSVDVIDSSGKRVGGGDFLYAH